MRDPRDYPADAHGECDMCYRDNVSLWNDLDSVEAGDFQFCAPGWRKILCKYGPEAFVGARSGVSYFRLNVLGPEPSPEGPHWHRGPDGVGSPAGGRSFVAAAR